MQRIKRRSAQAWRDVVARFAQSGLTEEAFCEREGIGVKLFHRWRSKRGNAPSRRPADKSARVSSAPAGFVDLGGIGSGGSRFEVRLELGAGIVLRIARG
jgi:hypothetical protein